MRNYVGEDVSLFSIIVFSERCELKKDTVESPDVKVIKRDRIYAAVRDIWNQSRDVLSEEKINGLYDGLAKLTNVDETVKAAHIDNIIRKYKKEEKEQEPTVKIGQQELICLRCESALVLQTAKIGGIL